MNKICCIGPDSSCDAVSTSLVLLQQLANRISAAVVATTQLNDTMNARAALSSPRAWDALWFLLASIAHWRASVIFVARGRDIGTQQSLAKSADDYGAMATLLDAGAAMSEDAHDSLNFRLVLASLDSLHELSRTTSSCMGADRLCVPLSAPPPPALLSDICTVCCELPDSAMSTMSGRGMTSFVKGLGAAGLACNVILVHPRVPTGAHAEYVIPEDVRLTFKGESGLALDAYVTVGRMLDGSFKLAYSLAADCSSELTAHIAVCDHNQL